MANLIGSHRQIHRLHLKILMNHIRERLPDMKARINALISQTQQELGLYGDGALTGKAQKVCHDNYQL